MTTRTRNPKLGDVVDRLIDTYFQQVAGPMPGQVVVYNPATQTADVKPVVQQWIDGELTGFPVIRNIPVAFPQGGGAAITWPLTAGDDVYLVPSGVGIGAWHASGAEGETKSKRRFSLADCVALPGIRSLASPLPATAYAANALVLSGADIRLGSSAASDYVALASLVLALFQALEIWLNAHVHSGVTTGVGTSGSPTVPSPAPTSPAATTTKAL